jgi:multidrug resistance efflux pump
MSSEPKKRTWPWVATKILVAITLIVYGASVIIPRMVEVTAIDAVITARVLTVRAANAGTLTASKGVPGQWFEKGAELGRVESKPVDSGLLRDTEAELEQQGLRLQALEAQYVKLGAVQKQLEAEGTTSKKTDILVAQAQLETVLGDVRRRLDILRATAKREGARLALVQQTAVTAPVAGLLWKLQESPGSQVAEHTPLFQLLDASTFFVDASVSKDDLPYLVLGAPAQVKPMGKDVWYDGVIQSVIGPGAHDENENFAAGGPALHPNEYRVQIQLKLSGDDRPKAMALLTGTRAAVYFGRRTNAFDVLFTLSR